MRSVRILAVMGVAAMAVFVADGIGSAQEGGTSAEESVPVVAEGAPTADAAEEAPLAQTPNAGRMAEIWQSVKTNWRLGGPTMYALAFLAVVGVASALDRILGLRRGRVAPAGLADTVNRLWQQEQYDKVISVARASNSSLGRAVVFMVEHRSNPYELINSGAEDIAMRDFEVHDRRNYPLSAVGTIAPLLGLMGTVFGLMGAFATIGVVGSMDEPSALAGDIGEAMITTATGLIIAVPTLGLYHYFSSRTSRYAGILGEEVTNLMHAWFLKRNTE